MMFTKFMELVEIANQTRERANEIDHSFWSNETPCSDEEYAAYLDASEEAERKADSARQDAIEQMNDIRRRLSDRASEIGLPYEIRDKIEDELLKALEDILD